MSHSVDPELSRFSKEIMGEGPLIGEEIEVSCTSGTSSLLSSTTILPIPTSPSFSIFKSPISNISFPSSSAPRKHGDSNTIQIGRHKFMAMGAQDKPITTNQRNRNSSSISNRQFINLSSTSPGISMIKQEPQTIFCPPNATLIPIESIPLNFNLPIHTQLGNFSTLPINESAKIENNNIVVVKAEETPDMQILELDESQVANLVEQQQMKTQNYNQTFQNYGQIILCNENAINVSELFSSNAVIIDKEGVGTVETPNYSVSTIQTTEKKSSKKAAHSTPAATAVQEFQVEPDGTVVEVKKKGLQDFKCQEPMCGRNVSNVQDLRNHLANDHNVTFMEEQRHFESEDDFKQWKCSYEREHQVSFIYRGGTKKISAEKAVTYLICHRSGTYKSTVDGETSLSNESPVTATGSARKRKLKPQGSCKIGTYCTAGIKLLKNLENGGIDAFICHTHYAHEIMNPKHLRMNNNLKQEIWAKFDSGLSFSEILQHIHHNPEALDGYRIIDRRAVRNIYDQWRKHQKSLKAGSNLKAADDAFKLAKRKSSLRAFNPALFDEAILKLINHAEESISETVLYYKKSGDETPVRGNPTGHELYKNDMCLILQTQVQKELLQKYSTVINLEEVTGDELDIVGIVVLDEFLMSIPVGWMVCSNSRDSVVQHFFSTISANSTINCDYLFATRRGGLHKLWYAEFEHKPRALYPIEDTFRELKAILRKFYESSVKRTEFFQTLEKMVLTPDKEIFEANLEIIKQITESELFLHVFTQDWLEIKYRWAYHTRPQIPIDMEDSFAKLRKFILFKGTRSIGKNIGDLLKIGYDKIFQHNKNIFKGDIKQQTILDDISNKHDTSFKEGFQSKVQDLGNNKYQIEEHIIYDLKTMCTCKLACIHCGFCSHRFHCPCSDSQFCVHCHGIGIYQQMNLDPLQLVVIPDIGNVIEPDRGSERWGSNNEYYDIMCSEIGGESNLNDTENQMLVDIDFTGLPQKDPPAPRLRRREPRTIKMPEPRKKVDQKPSAPPFLVKVEPNAKSNFDNNHSSHEHDGDVPPPILTINNTSVKKEKKASITVTVIPIITTTTPTMTRPQRTSTRLQQSKSDEKKTPHSKSALKKAPRLDSSTTPKIQPQKLRVPSPPQTRQKKELVVTPSISNPKSKSKMITKVDPIPVSPPSPSPPIRITRSTRSSIKKEAEIIPSTPKPTTSSSKSISKKKQPTPHEKSKKESLRKELLGLMNKIDNIEDEKVIRRLRKKMTDLSSVVDSA